MKKIVSGIQPTNRLTLGNYLGAIKELVTLQDQYEMYIFVADLHALSVNFDAKTLYQNKLNLVASYQTLGLDLTKNIVFNQSDVAAHTALSWILTCHTTMGELSRMTQFKDKSAKLTLSNKTTSIPTGLFMYPALMASDVLLYDADYVLVGADQKQHLELTRDIAIRINNKYGNVFKVPEPMIPKQGAKIMDLLNPLVKMSKSNANERGTIFLLDTPQVAQTKIMGAKTDSFNKVNYNEQNQPGISNLLTIYSCLTNQSIPSLITKYHDKNYGEFKNDLAKVVVDFLTDFQNRYTKIISNQNELVATLQKNATRCQQITTNKLVEVYKAIGLLA